MTEKDLILQLKELKEIRPRKDWVILAKSQILGPAFAEAMAGKQEERKWDLSPIFGWKLAFVPIISVFLIIGVFGFAQNTVPGDFLFSVKKITETVQVGISSDMEKPGVYLRLANKRLEELSRIAETNQVRNLGPAIEEVQKQLAEVDINVSRPDSLALKEIAEEAQKFEKNKQKVEKALGIKINTEKYENVLEKYAAYLIADLENRTLTEEDQKLLGEAKEAFETGDYSFALEKLWLLSNQ